MRKTFLPFSPPNIGEEEIAEVAETLRSDWITTGPRTQRFEREFAAAIRAPQCLAVNSGTAALHLAMVISGIGPGAAVFTTPMTFCSVVHAIEHAGARPVLVDVEPDTLNLDPERLCDELKNFRNSVNAKYCPKAILPVHLYGHPCEIDSLMGIARQQNLAVIEDAAHALPARYKGRSIGSQDVESGIRLITCFSFYATKNMTTAEGGMLAAAPGLVEDARIWSLHGMSRDAWRRYGAGGSWFYEVIHPGFKYNMSDVQAAIGLQQLRKLPRFHARRKEIARRYNEAFSQFESLHCPVERSNVDHAWHLYVLRLNLDRLSITRNQFIQELAARNIGSSVHFIPIHLHRYYREKYGFRPEDFPVAYREYGRIVSLPLHPGMTDEDTQDVIEAVSEIADKGARRRIEFLGPLRTPAESLGQRGFASKERLAPVTTQHVFDGVCAAVGLCFLSPLLALIAVAIKLDDGGPVFYSQCRVGKGLKKFRLLKFRSMSPGSSGCPLTGPRDPRVTRVGRVLRRFKLDELPQLVNVLKGEMQLVGVRPQVERYVEVFRDQYEELLQVEPGITDLACLCFRNEEQLFAEGSIEQQYIDRILPAKLDISLRYMRNRTFLSDLEILFRTILGFHSPGSPGVETKPAPLMSSLPKANSKNSA